MESTFADRFISARKMAGMSLQELADSLGDVSKQALHQYEQGKARPDSERLIRIAQVLGVRVNYFFRSERVILQNVEFRKRVKLTKTEEEKVREQTIDFLERYHELESLLDAQITFENPIEGTIINSFEDIDPASERLRDAWKLGRDSIGNVIETLEDRGIKVFQVSANESFDGLSAVGNDSLVIVVNTIFDVVRQRFTTLHELAHCVLRFNPDIPEKQVEKLCHAFAGAFLLPKETFIEEMTVRRRYISLAELVQVKEQYGVSIQAIMARAKALDIISDSSYQDFSILFSKLGYRKNEPGRYTGQEKALRFKQLLYRAAAEEIISMSKAAALNNQKLAEFRQELTGLTHG
jgi:Zn-dependent peptidase ImmA (M78 family)/DNA-binding XRE family transcriptional regulator